MPASVSATRRPTPLQRARPPNRQGKHPARRKSTGETGTPNTDNSGLSERFYVSVRPESVGFAWYASYDMPRARARPRNALVCLCAPVAKARRICVAHAEGRKGGMGGIEGVTEVRPPLGVLLGPHLKKGGHTWGGPGDLRVQEGRYMLARAAAKLT